MPERDYWRLPADALSLCALCAQAVAGFNALIATGGIVELSWVEWSGGLAGWLTTNDVARQLVSQSVSRQQVGGKSEAVYFFALRH